MKEADREGESERSMTIMKTMTIKQNKVHKGNESGYFLFDSCGGHKCGAQ